MIDHSTSDRSLQITFTFPLKGSWPTLTSHYVWTPLYK